MRVLALRLDQVDRSEPARIDEAYAPAVVGFQFDVLVQRDLVAADRLHHHAPGHSEMQKHRPPAVQPHQYVFRPASKTGHPRAGQAHHQTWGQGPAHIRPPGDRAQQNPSLQPQPQALHHSLNFGEFRHIC